MDVAVIARLESSRKNIILTLEHIREKQTEADSNTEWKNLAAQRRRSELLADLLGWYNGRLRRIDRVLGQAAIRHSQAVAMKPVENASI